jgi:hypothetical protein
LLDQILEADSGEARDIVIRRLRQQRNPDRGHSACEVLDKNHDGSLAIKGIARNIEDEEDDEDSDKDECDAVRDMTSLLAHLDVDEAGTVYSVGATSNATRTRATRKTSFLGETSDMRTINDFSTQPLQISSFDLGSLISPVYLTPLEHHLLRLYFTWQHPIAHLFSQDRFSRDLCNGYGNCYSPLLLSVLLSIGTHYSRFADEAQGDMYFARAKTLLASELERPSLTTCQALVLMGAREAGCGREHGSGWLYAGMGFRMQIALGTDRNMKKLDKHGYLSTEDVEERAFTYYGSFVHDRGWTAYLGRSYSLPYQEGDNALPMPDRGIPAGTRTWTAYTDDDFDANTMSQQSLGMCLRAETGSFKHLCQLSNLLGSVVCNLYDKAKPPSGKLSANSNVVTELHMSLQSWYNKLPQYMRLGCGTSPPPIVLVAHMFYHAALILLFRPFIRPRHAESPTRTTTSPYDVSPQDICTNSALSITKCLKEYQHLYSLRRFSNWLVHAVLTSATIYVINTTGRVRSSSHVTAPNAMCDSLEATRKLEDTITALDEMGEAWMNARRCAQQIQQWAERYKICLRNTTVITKVANLRVNEAACPEAISTVSTDFTTISMQQSLATPLMEYYTPISQEKMYDMDFFQQQLNMGWQYNSLDYG